MERTSEPGLPRGTSPARVALSLPWLVRLRWGVVAGQAMTVVVGALTLGADLPWPAAVAPIVVAIGSNAWLATRRGRPSPSWLCGAVLAGDTVLLTILLHVTGGPMNPFSVLYLVHVTLAAVVLGARWTGLLAGLSVAGYAVLFAWAGGAGAHASHVAAGYMTLHLQAMLVAFAVAAALTAHVVVQLSAAIDRRDAELALARADVARAERLAALTTLAAGAAHELATPLGTIAIAAAELDRALAEHPGLPLRDDARLIRGEVRRCRAILDRLASDGGAVRGEAPVTLRVATVVADVRDALAADARRVHVVEPAPDAVVRAPRGALGSALASVVRNALQASRADESVRLRVDADGTRVHIVVDDDGIGMPPDVLARAGEPFFTTRPPGRGMGLGLFLARTLCERLGGRLHLRSAPGRGTTVGFELPAVGASSREACGVV